MLSKKSQVTLFIIVGIIIVLSAISIFLFAKIFNSDTQTEFERIVDENANSQLNEYISNSVTHRTKELIYVIGKKGGTLNPLNTLFYGGSEYSYSCLNNGGRGCISNQYSKQSIKKSIEGEIYKLLDSMSFDHFEKQGYSLNYDKPILSVSLNPENLIVDIKWNILINKDEFESNLNAVFVNVETELHKLHSLATQITHQEIIAGSFDESKWMKDNFGSIKIYKHKPYPNTVYLLQKINPSTKERYEYLFAINGRDTTLNLDYHPISQIKGVCKVDKECYPNVDSCDYGIFDSNVNSCSFEDFNYGSTNNPTDYYDSECNGDDCSGCGIYSHGESWCVTDGITAPGFSPPGSRFFKQSCIDGQIYNTECRDYRDELCTQTTGEFTTAVCRVNRWKDCAKQTNENSCNDDSKRDCYWADWLVKSQPFETVTYDYSKRKCLPYVPPGFKFWKTNYLMEDACSMANEEFDCDDTSCPQSWVDSTSSYCYFMGDCGNYFNFENSISSTNSYHNTDTPVSDYVYELPRSKQEMYVLNLDLDKTSYSLKVQIFHTIHSISSIRISIFINTYPASII